jgi:restriction system protein
MAIPDFQSIMLPLLQYAGDGREHSLHEAHDYLADHFGLTSEEVNELLPSGVQRKFYNRVGWARAYLIKSGLIVSTRRGYFQITDRGKQVLAENPDRIDMKYLERFPEYRKYKTARRSSAKENKTDQQKTATEESKTPQESLEEAYQEMRETLAQELLQKVMESPPAFFERLVVELLVAMGYGGSLSDAARAVGQTGDEGIDGIIDEDRLGLDTIYIQAKRWQGTVSRPEIQKFVGALQGKRARKGIFITTSDFSRGARDYVSMIDTKVVLIDGRRLTEYMIDYNVGVSTVSKYEIKRIDTDYFENE